jgi:hypothetical protein
MTLDDTHAAACCAEHMHTLAPENHTTQPGKQTGLMLLGKCAPVKYACEALPKYQPCPCAAANTQENALSQPKPDGSGSALGLALSMVQDKPMCMDALCHGLLTPAKQHLSLSPCACAQMDEQPPCMNQPISLRRDVRWRKVQQACAVYHVTSLPTQDRRHACLTRKHQDKVAMSQWKNASHSFL